MIKRVDHNSDIGHPNKHSTQVHACTGINIVNKYTPHRCVVSVTNTLPALTSVWAGSISSNTALRKQEISWRTGGAVTFIKFPHLYLFHIFLTNYVSTELSLSHIFLGHRLFQRSLHCHSNSNSWHHPHQKPPGNFQLKSSSLCNSFFTDCQLLFRYPVYLEIKFDRGGEMHLVYCAFKVLAEPL